MKAYQTSNKAIFQLNYHIIWCPKYRRSLLVGGVKSRLNEIIKDVSKENNYKILASEIMPNHVHLCISCSPNCPPHRIVKSLKGRTSNLLRKEFPELTKMCTLWTRSYFVATVGNVSTDTVTKYIEDQWKK